MDMVKHLLPQVAQYYKANLHTHSTISDGKLTPQELKEAYKSKGYSILSITDHNVVADHSDLTDNSFLMLTGAEYNIDQTGGGYHRKTYHLNFIAKRPELLWQPFANPTYREDVMPYINKAEIDDLPRIFDTDAVNAVIARANEKGHLVMYNHPIWSLNDYTDYCGLKGLWAMELCNYDSFYHDGFADQNNSMVYRDLVNLTGSIFPVGADDAHSAAFFAGAWIMVGAEKLEYASVIEALEKGDFYASTGPEIYQVTWDGTYLDVDCSDAVRVSVECGNRYAFCERPVSNDGLMRHAHIDISWWTETVCKDRPNDWLRVIVHGPYGHYASTRAFHFRELK